MSSQRAPNIVCSISPCFAGRAALALCVLAACSGGRDATSVEPRGAVPEVGDDAPAPDSPGELYVMTSNVWGESGATGYLYTVRSLASGEATLEQAVELAGGAWLSGREGDRSVYVSSGDAGSSPRLTRQGPRLTLAGDDASLEFIESSLLNPDRPLTGRTWTIDTLIAADQARSVSLEPTISFQINGTLQVFTTCTTGSGLYAAGAPTLAITDMEYIEKPCDASGDASVDEPIRRVLTDGDLRFEIDTARLTSTRGSDGLQAQTE
jgi:hypothetical protein